MTTKYHMMSRTFIEGLRVTIGHHWYSQISDLGRKKSLGLKMGARIYGENVGGFFLDPLLMWYT